ncbi:branched-chain amino acid ABC transporter substrate-binding protein [Paenibacillus oleatilyticus]|uniref:branched-chain amino acid ABC transporter substrate-binding protein n=1 Tax=Paenibacillus oleatilyticus TaxID=2594886 RepID=UPI001C1FCF97|nr:branched-chain amino acid ABC transporter substrate-binding protein [Paenibacillus oleatilyticus]MBU7317858.1 branched-chain amino acid ABC transporter substrate-binding protein [Paenibacillus oleatilyticus]
MKKQTSIGIATVILGMLALTACGGNSDGAKSAASSAEGSAYGKEIKIGMMSALSGNEAKMGQDMKQAAELAVDEINAAGGINGSKIKLVAQDDACDPQTATAAANKLVSEGVTAVVGGYCSGAAIPATGVFHQNGIPTVITAANSQKIADQKFPEIFMINGTGVHQAQMATEYMVNQKQAKKIAIIHDNSAFAKDLAEVTKKQVESAGAKVVVFDAVNPDETDFSSLVSKLKQAQPDATYWTAYYKGGGLFIKQFKQQGVSGIIGVGDGANDKMLIDIAGKAAAEGTFITNSPTAEFLPDAKKFVDDYKGRFSQEPGPYSALQYDGIKVMADAIKRAGSTDKKAITEALAKSDVKTLTGQVSFTPQGTLTKSNFVVLQVKEGTFAPSK